jgi:hypothetical protein
MAPFYFHNVQVLNDLGTTANRFQWNVRALTVLKAITEAGREATAEEAAILAHYSAFGESSLIQKAVQIVDGQYQPTEEMADLLTVEEAGGIARAALTAFYTPLWLAQAIWNVVAPALNGIEQPRILEPATGTGIFFATMPQELRERSALMGVELDHVSSRIFQALHPDVRHFGAQGFEDSNLPENAFDLTISNVPFASVKVTDPMFGRSEKELCGTLHDFFIAKMMKLTRPGGLVVALTSYGTMDKKRETVRRWLAGQGRLVAAFRLPNGLFMQGAGSASGCDLLIFQKYAAGEQPETDQPWISSVRCLIQAGTPSVSAVTSQAMDYGTETQLSSLFTPESKQVFGTYMSIHSYRYGASRSYYVVEPCENVEYVATECLRALQAPLVPAQRTSMQVEVAPTIRAASNDMIVFAEAKNAKEQTRIEAARAVFVAAKAVFAAEISDALMSEVEELRVNLNAAYDTFVVSYGVFNSKDNKRVLGGAILEYPVLLALETNPRIEAGKVVADKAPVFSQRISQVRRSPVAGSCTLEEALTWSLAEKARVDLHLIATLAGVTPDEAAQGLTGRIYRDLDATTEKWVLADELLSGNVREKLALARRLSTLYPAFAAHVPALEAVQPALLTRAEIKINLGATWLATEVIAQFIGTLVPEFKSYEGTVEFHAAVHAWKVTAPRQARGSYAALHAWATDRRNFFDIFDCLLHQRELVVMDEFEDEGGKIVRRMNQPATAAANAVGDRIKEAFQNWLWADEARAQDLERKYNDLFNVTVERRYNGDHLSIAGLNTTGLRTGDADQHQKDVIWRILCQQATYIAHPVGAGKTLTMLGGISEALRRGMAHKVLVCVPNSIVQQWAADVLRFFPGLRVLAMTAKDFEKSRRRQFLAHIATGQWDIVVVGTTTFTRLPLPLAVRRRFYEEEISSLRAYLHDLYNQDGRSDKEKKRDRALKRIESRVQTLEAKLKALDATIKREDEQVLNLVELGFDMLVVDEFHLYKNLVRR